MSDDAVRDGHRAEILLSDPLIQGFFEEYERRIFDTWCSSRDADREGRERLYCLLLCLKAFRSHLESYVDNGRIAELAKDTRKRTTRILGIF